MIRNIMGTAAGVMAVAVVSVGGCSPIPDPGPLLGRLPPAMGERLPPALLYVIDQAERFVLDDDDPLLDHDPGTQIDDLAGVGGCWGSVLQASSRNVAAIYFFVRFNESSGRYEDWLVTDLGGLYGFNGFISAQHTAGPYEVGPGARLATTRELTELFGPQPESFNAPSDLSVDDFEWFDVPGARTLQYLATRSGDRLRLHFGPADRVQVDPGDDNIYVRFDCPSE